MHDTTETIPTTMKATVQTGFGDPSTVLRVTDVPTPELAADGVLVRVRAASVHIGAVHIVRGLPRLVRPLYKRFADDYGVIGQNVAGTVQAVGSDVTEFAVGDEVFGWSRGGFATYAATTADTLAPKPDALTWEQAAAIGVSAFTALQALQHGSVREGQHVLVTGASGGVGTFAVQIARAMGAQVTGVCRTRNLDLVRSLGADRVIDYTQQDVTQVADRYDVVIDIAAAAPLRRMRRLLTDDGVLVVVGGPAPSGMVGGLVRPLGIALTALFSRRQTSPLLSAENTADLQVLRELAATGRITPVIDRVVPLEQAVEGIAAVGAGSNRGTTVISM